MCQWTDGVLLPAIYDKLPPSVKQHLPSSYDHSYYASLAKGKGNRAKGSTIYQSRIQTLSYHLPPESLVDIWDSILARIEQPGYRHFRGIQLFMSGKNFKLATQGKTIRETCDILNKRWEVSVSEEYLDLDKTFIDIGKEICAPRSYILDDEVPDNRQPQTYLWRRCCLDACYRKSLLGDTARLSLRRFYPESMLRDSAGMTVLTAKKSKSRAAGLIYSQFYNSVKEINDAAKSRPFDNSALESLALDPHIFKTYQSTARSHNHDIHTIEGSYLNSKAHIHAGIVGSMQKSFGTREEHRMTMTLMRLLVESWKDKRVYDKKPKLSKRVPFYSVPTQHFLSFLQVNVNKFAYAFEHTLLTCSPEFISWEKTKLMVLFLRYLRLSIVTRNLAAESAIWIHRKRTMWSNEDGEANVVKEGMGAKYTMEKLGYCWMMPKIDWKDWRFES